MVELKIFMIILLLSIVCSTVAQSDTISTIECFGFSVESMPSYSGGEEQLNKFIESQINFDSITYPSPKGVVFISCWVDTLGNTISHKILKGIRKDLDNEALRVARLVKFDEPAKQGGIPLKIQYTIPVKFRINPCRSGFVIKTH